MPKPEPHIWRRYKTKRDRERFYKSLIPSIRELARESGYAIGVHGSLKRDLDLIAVPWVEGAVLPSTLQRRISNLVIGKTYWHFNKKQAWTDKPNGRKATVIMVGANVYIDLSVVPYTPCI